MPQWSLRLRLRLQSGIRIGTWTRLAGRRHRGRARRGRFEDRLAVWLLAVEQILDFITRQRFELQQGLCKSFEIILLLGQNSSGGLIGLVDETPHLRIDL